MKKRLHAYFSGSVQGVGFRFTVERLAENLGLKGWVKNLRDGRVEVLCEGKEADLAGLLYKLNEIFKNYISDSDEEWGEATGEFESFEVKF